jgi:hypothetical protein
MAWIAERMTKKGKKWYVYDNNAEGLPYCVPNTGTFDYGNAVKLRKNHEDMKSLGANGIIVPATAKTVQEGFDRYLAESKETKKKKTVLLIKNATLPFLIENKNKKLLSLRRSDITDMLVETLKSNDGNRSGANIRLVAVKAFLQYCVKNKWIPESPASGIKLLVPEEVALALGRSELAKILRAARIWDYYRVSLNIIEKTRIQRMMQFAAYTGLRISELLSLSKPRSFKNGCIFLPGKSTKSGKSRLIPPEGSFAQVCPAAPGRPALAQLGHLPGRTCHCAGKTAQGCGWKPAI